MRQVGQTGRRMMFLLMPRIELLNCRVTKRVAIDGSMEVRV